VTVKSGGGLRSIVQRLIENLSQTSDDGDSKVVLLRQLRSSNNWTALRACERLKAIGALDDGTLRELNLTGANLAGADLFRANLGQANLQDAILTEANLQEARMSGVDLLGASLIRANISRADLSSANLFRAKLTDANLQEAFLFQVDLRGADLRGAALQGARLSSAHLDGATINISQLIHAGMLSGSIMPDGSRYDGRFNLAGDVQFAQFLDMELDINSPAAMAEFYDVPLSEYMRGQAWAQNYLPKFRAALEPIESTPS
jgi:pentapeptide repeat protein